MTKNETKNPEIMPKRFLQFLGLLVLTVLLTVFTFRIMDFPLVGIPPKAAVAQEISLEFIERNRFDVVVLDKYGKALAESTDGSNGFLGVVYNAVKRERIKR